MNLPQEYLDDVLVRIAHHSSAIENNTITLAETVSIILNQTIPNRTSVREFYEVMNHQQAFHYLLGEAQKQNDDYIDIILTLHFYLMDHLHHERGKFKSEDNAIVGADFQTMPAYQTYEVMMQWADNIKHREKFANSEEEKLEIMAESHIQFERIHPFADGNGRVGRLFICYFLLKHDLSFLVIEKEHKQEYIYFLAQQDTEGFTRFMEAGISNEKQRLRQFAQSQSKLDDGNTNE